MYGTRTTRVGLGKWNFGSSSSGVIILVKIVGGWFVFGRIIVMGEFIIFMTRSASIRSINNAFFGSSSSFKRWTKSGIPATVKTLF
jgi:hypothetical protein